MNKTNSAIRLVHRPSGLVVTAQEQRGQHGNKKAALARLSALLSEQASRRQKQSKEAVWTRHDDIVRGEAARTYRGTEFTRM